MVCIEELDFEELEFEDLEFEDLEFEDLEDANIPPQARAMGSRQVIAPIAGALRKVPSVDEMEACPGRSDQPATRARTG
jgi:hypothetical protein